MVPMVLQPLDTQVLVALKAKAHPAADTVILAVWRAIEKLEATDRRRKGTIGSPRLMEDSPSSRQDSHRMQGTLLLPS